MQINDQRQDDPTFCTFNVRTGDFIVKPKSNDPHIQQMTNVTQLHHKAQIEERAKHVAQIMDEIHQNDKDSFKYQLYVSCFKRITEEIRNQENYIEQPYLKKYKDSYYKLGFPILIEEYNRLKEERDASGQTKDDDDNQDNPTNFYDENPDNDDDDNDHQGQGDDDEDDYDQDGTKQQQSQPNTNHNRKALLAMPNNPLTLNQVISLFSMLMCIKSFPSNQKLFLFSMLRCIKSFPSNQKLFLFSMLMCIKSFP